MRKGIIGLAVLFLGLWAVAVEPEASAGNWARFRGPNGTGTVDDKDVPVEFGGSKNVLWKCPLAGTGHSSPIVWEDKVFLEAASADNKERMLVCIDAGQGSVLWSKAISGNKAKMHPKNSPASCTPATDGERVYATFWDGSKLSLHAYDFKGNHVWDRDLGPFNSQHGAGHSPIVYKDKVLLMNDNDDSAAILAFDAKTGKPAWGKPRPKFRACYSTPFIYEGDGGPELIVASTQGITSYNPDSGAENWKWNWSFDGMALRTVGSPIASNGLIVATSGDGSGLRHTVAVKAGGKGDVTRTNLVWENKAKGVPYVPTPLTRGEHIYYVNDKGFAACHEAKTGKQLWYERLADDGVSASPVMIDGKIYVVSEKGNVFVIEAAPKYKLVARNALGEGVMASPAVANNRLYIRGRSALYCIGKKSSN